MSKLKALTLLMIAVTLLTGGLLHLFRWAENYDYFSLEDVCAAYVKGFVEYGTRAVGPPPAGWAEKEEAACIRVEGNLVYSDTVKVVLGAEHMEYCAAWLEGQKAAIIILGPKAEPRECTPLLPLGGGGIPSEV